MSLPSVPNGYSNWNEYIRINAPALATAQSITLQQAKASLKLSMVSAPTRAATGTNSYRTLNVFTTWALKSNLPTIGRPWRT